MSDKVEIEKQWKDEMVKLAGLLLQEKELNKALEACQAKISDYQKQYQAIEQQEAKEEQPAVEPEVLSN
jgi:hypothetical protein